MAVDIRGWIEAVTDFVLIGDDILNLLKLFHTQSIVICS